jgi:hypothetical protein
MTTLTADVIGRKAEFNHPETGRLMVGTVHNIFKNGKVQIRPVYSRDGDALSLLEGVQPLVNVRAERCEFWKFDWEL